MFLKAIVISSLELHLTSLLFMPLLIWAFQALFLIRKKWNGCGAFWKGETNYSSGVVGQTGELCYNPYHFLFLII
jgi:hypothetical protein